MNLVKFDPFRGFDSLARRMNNFMTDFEIGRNFSTDVGTFTPRVDIREDEKNIYLSAEIPGLSKEDVKVSINDDNVLTIKGEKKLEEKKEEENYVKLERQYGSFVRSFVLPENVDTESVKASFKDGLLELTLERLEPVKPKEIDVEIS